MKPQKIKDQEELERSGREEATYKCPTATIMGRPGIQPQAELASIGEEHWRGPLGWLWRQARGKVWGGGGAEALSADRPSFPILSLPTA